MLYTSVNVSIYDMFLHVWLQSQSNAHGVLFVKCHTTNVNLCTDVPLHWQYISNVMSVVWHVLWHWWYDMICVALPVWHLMFDICQMSLFTAVIIEIWIWQMTHLFLCSSHSSRPTGVINLWYWHDTPF